MKLPHLAAVVSIVSIVPVAFASGCAASGPRALSVAGLRCELQKDPIGIDVREPRLSWIVSSPLRGQLQASYRILAASSTEDLARDKGDLWDTGVVSSPETIGIAWAGKPLGSRQRVHWKVQAWDPEGRASGWSDPALFEMGLLEPGDWKARWISMDRPRPASHEEFYRDRPAPLLRKEFALARKPARARMYAVGLGFHELRLNGEKVSDDLLDPPWTDVSKRVFYAVHDVTDLLKEGPNAIGVMLGDGWFDPLPLRMWGRFNLREALPVGEPRAIVQLEIEHEDGSRETVASDASWKAAGGPIVRNSVYLGETYDARLERPGWDRPGLDDRDWKPAALAAPPGGALKARPIPPVRATWSTRAEAITEPSPGTFIFDMGRNITGRAILRARGPAGTRVTMRYGELLQPDGSLNPLTAVCGQIKRPGIGGPGAPDVAVQTDAYILGGKGDEIWAPRFTFHGFRYVEVTGYPGRPDPDALRAEALHTDIDWSGFFTCSSDLFVRIRDLARRTFRNNLLGVQSDCPHREKFGYGGDIVATSEAAIFLFDMAAFYAKTVRDFSDAARPDGGLTETAPFVGIADGGLSPGSGPIGWGTVHPLLLDQLHRYHGDRRLIEEEYETAKRWVDFLAARAKDGTTISEGISDHESLEPKPVELTSTAFLAWNARLLARLARTLSRKADADGYDALASRVEAAFRKKFLDPATGRVGPGTQTAQSFALALDLLPAEARQPALDVLVKDIEAHQDHLTTGIFGTKFLLDVLSEGGRGDLAARIVGQTTFPGWGHMLERGATSLWEHWEFSDDVYSHNHPMFGSVAEWFFKWVGGIRPAPDAVGFDRIIIAPSFETGLTSARASHDSVRGRVEASWKIEGGRLTLDVFIPVGSSAEVHILTASPGEVLEGQRPAGEAPGVKFLRIERGRAVFAVASGRYRFACTAVGAEDKSAR